MGKAIIDHLADIAAEDDQGRAAKAIYVAATFGTKRSAEIVEKAAKSRKRAVRLAAAAAASHVDEVTAHAVIDRLLKSKTTISAQLR